MKYLNKKMDSKDNEIGKFEVQLEKVIKERDNVEVEFVGVFEKLQYMELKWVGGEDVFKLIEVIYIMNQL